MVPYIHTYIHRVLVGRLATLQVSPWPMIAHLLACYQGGGSRNCQSWLQKEHQGSSCCSRQTRWENSKTSDRLDFLSGCSSSHYKAWSSFLPFILRAKSSSAATKVGQNQAEFVWADPGDKIMHHKFVIYANESMRKNHDLKLTVKEMGVLSVVRRWSIQNDNELPIL